MSQRPIHDASDDPTADTHPAAAAVMDALWRAMSGEEKLALADRWSREPIELSLVGFAQRYPNDSREELELRAAHVRYGRELMERLTGTRFDWRTPAHERVRNEATPRAGHALAGRRSHSIAWSSASRTRCTTCSSASE